jgi:hypothetical protein
MQGAFNGIAAMLRKSIGATAVTLLLTGAAVAQFSNTGNTGNTGSGLGMNMMPGERRVSPEEAQREREIEARYNATKDQIPEKKASKDPWGNVRSAPASSAQKQSR